MYDSIVAAIDAEIRKLEGLKAAVIEGAGADAVGAGAVGARVGGGNGAHRPMNMTDRLFKVLKESPQKWFSTKELAAATTISREIAFTLLNSQFKKGRGPVKTKKPGTNEVFWKAKV